MTEKTPESETFDLSPSPNEYSLPDDEGSRHEEESTEGSEGFGNQEVVDALNAALKEIADQQKRQLLAIVAPASDTVELQPSWSRIYKIGTQNFICGKRMTNAPKLRTNTRSKPQRDKGSLNALLGHNINKANLASLKRSTQ